MAENRRNVDEFLDLYKRVEEQLEARYRHARRRYPSLVLEFLRDQESLPVREKLDIAREIRNLLTHSADLDGEPVVEPSEPVVQGLREVLEYLRKPALALDYAAKGDRLLKADLNRKALRLMEVMEKNGFSHVPVLREGGIYGVFSAGTVFRYQLEHKGRALREQTTLGELGAVLELKSNSEHYAFLPKTATYQQAREVFQRIRGRNRRISAIFITESGRPGERLLGMLTPWDVLGQPE